ncbi:MAG: hypothetical protein R3A51_16235 [Nannocystaceae bacterium]|nr:hypothetical protein [Myxococcales bacterium]
MLRWQFVPAAAVGEEVHDELQELARRCADVPSDTLKHQLGRCDSVCLLRDRAGALQGFFAAIERPLRVQGEDVLVVALAGFHAYPWARDDLSAALAMIGRLRWLRRREPGRRVYAAAAVGDDAYRGYPPLLLRVWALWRDGLCGVERGLLEALARRAPPRRRAEDIAASDPSARLERALTSGRHASGPLLILGEPTLRSIGRALGRALGQLLRLPRRRRVTREVVA